MADFMYLMHNDETAKADDGWLEYIKKLEAKDCFRGGSAIGSGKCARKQLDAPDIYHRVVGYIRIEAASLAEA